MPNTTINKRIDFTDTHLPLASCFVLLITAGFLYIAGFGKGIVYAFCYTILPASAGALANAVFKKLRFVANMLHNNPFAQKSFTLLCTDGRAEY